ncbi:50S ribosomal protein L24 [Candidatus Uhrbacteria bacterium RIFCSPHIGHO2_01_FULL_63_20]|uniref:Large ribosomal subunit protein uL24 n=1 Tax=Candidatus Uhrbacteria bacterium RIFCSPHIGHO2_01_FULL_63_20 TaxID=1802385 RepID=A0A1F7TNJ9_9BACT|nr:MAG: 50S ribosomal protein L24 [Candidatus Uhrbacteria bacterium RIFCSPHIGHO2_01_FULL_63_20]
MKIKTGDMVRVIAGKDKGKQGKVLQVFPLLERVVVEGVNVRTRHLRGNRAGGQKGQKIQFPSPLNVSNVMMVGKSGSGRVGFKILASGEKVRVLRSKGKTEDIG